MLTPEEIIQKRRENEEKVISFRKTLNESLYSLCEKSTGHDWWGEWKDTSWFDVGGEFHRQLSRKCHLCGKTETKKEE